MKEVNDNNRIEIHQRPNRLQTFLLLFLSVLILFVGIYYFIARRAGLDIFESNEPTQSVSTQSSDKNDLYVYKEIPLKYWSINTAPTVTINARVPQSSDLLEENNGIKQTIVLPDGSKLSFSISHVAETKELASTTIIPIETESYDHIFRYESEGKMVYANVTETGNCREPIDGLIKAPCGAPIFYGIVISCESQNGDYSMCDAVVKTISGI